MLEFLPPELATQYLRAIQPQSAEQVFGAPILKGSSLEEYTHEWSRKELEQSIW